MDKCFTLSGVLSRVLYGTKILIKEAYGDTIYSGVWSERRSGRITDSRVLNAEPDTFTASKGKLVIEIIFQEDE